MTFPDSFLSSNMLIAGLTDPFFPKPTSTNAGSVDDLFYFILAVCIVFFAIIVAAMVIFMSSIATVRVCLHSRRRRTTIS